ncbi:SpoIID/LytB domain-containing protein [Synechococcales cyanobacterium C]|uniref:SpoIID/LytB domain-containing protein n=1 Tax=Petrachloros mirabilis ULC683 TaxID=2781853 RepID=A0A8K2ABT1_9CYAN|nr:SpoIID/LytB domain-containing protein [Petrachloros mirabilis]NCJ05130.1 SpoIID/LytB domain-containing protein [Petrachloros mirabilis ULC683]
MTKPTLFRRLSGLKKAAPLLLPLLLGAAAIPPVIQQRSDVPLSEPQALEQSALELSGLDWLTIPEPEASTQVETAPESSPEPPAAPAPAASPSSLKNQQPFPSSTDRRQSFLMPVTPSIPTPPAEIPQVPLRVAITTGASTLTLGASTGAVITDAQGYRIGELGTQSAVQAIPAQEGIQIGDWQAPTVLWVQPQGDGLVYVEGRWYRGPVQVIRREQRLLAVNHLDLESYLYSVVGAEMPASWSLEALKAQAIAARSYALVHIARPASADYDLGATPRWQAYTGVTTETNTTHEAVNATRGLFLSYQGGVVESLYAASDDIVKEVHRGFGMSQNGAQQLAVQQNFNFQQILGYFYPGTELSWLQLPS